MLPSELPSCPHCGGEEFESWGANIAPNFHRQGFKCPCGTFIKFIGHGGGNLLTYFHKNQQTPDKHDGFELPKEWGDWVNSTLLPTWREFEERKKAHETEEWNLWVAKEFRPKFPDLDYPGGKLSYYDIPKEAQEMVDALHGGPNVVQKYGTYLPFPPELQDTIVPPQAPVGFAMYYRDKDGDWIWIDPKQSAKLEAPEDPVLRRNREFFDGVWSQVGEALGTPLPAREEIKNEYGGIEPWYSFSLGGADFQIGWRKRVISINVRREEEFNTLDIRTKAVDRDHVTYESFKGLEKVEFALEDVVKDKSQLEAYREMYPDGKISMRDGGWKADHPEANEVLVHAWGQEKTVEYLTILCQAVG